MKPEQNRSQYCTKLKSPKLLEALLVWGLSWQFEPFFKDAFDKDELFLISEKVFKIFLVLLEKLFKILKARVFENVNPQIGIIWKIGNRYLENFVYTTIPLLLNPAQRWVLLVYSLLSSCLFLTSFYQEHLISFVSVLFTVI